MTPVFVTVAALAIAGTFLAVSRGRGILFALGASLLVLLGFAAVYFALVTIIVSSM